MKDDETWLNLNIGCQQNINIYMILKLHQNTTMNINISRIPIMPTSNSWSNMMFPLILYANLYICMINIMPILEYVEFKMKYEDSWVNFNVDSKQNIKIYLTLNGDQNKTLNINITEILP